MAKLGTGLVLILSWWLSKVLASKLPLLGTSISAIIIGLIIKHTPLYKKLDKKFLALSQNTP